MSSVSSFSNSNSSNAKIPFPVFDLCSQQNCTLQPPNPRHYIKDQLKYPKFEQNNYNFDSNNGQMCTDGYAMNTVRNNEGLMRGKGNHNPKLPIPAIFDNRIDTVEEEKQMNISNNYWFGNVVCHQENKINSIPRSYSVIPSMKNKKDKNNAENAFQLLKERGEISDETCSDMKPPEPFYFDEPNGGKYGVRCVCGKQTNVGLLVQCDKCEFWLHGICICLAKVQKDEPYFCPFCTHKVIRCSCKNNMKYDVPIVQCAKCKFWVHKSCENLKFGHVPNSFLCHLCGGHEFILPHIRPMFQSTNRVSFVECNRFDLIKSIPEGKFRDFVISDLNKSELRVHDTLDRYFHEFVFQIFQQNHEFWKVFVESMVSLLDSKQEDIISIIDQFARSLIYKKKTPQKQIIELEETISESAQYLTTMELPEVTDEPKNVYLNAYGKLCVSTPVDEDEFICELPGFIMNSDELNSNDGIPLSVIRIFDTDLIVDLESTRFEEFAKGIQRSFHYNCYANVYSDKNGAIKTGLFATRLKGPLIEFKKGHAINQDSPLFLPFDGEIPYPIPKNEWKSNKSKQKYKSSRTKVQKKADKSKTEKIFNISLLSGFYQDFVPPIPINLVSEKEFRFSHPQTNSKYRARSKHNTRNDLD